MSLKTAPNQITAHNAGGPSQFRFADGVFSSGVCEFWRYCDMRSCSSLLGESLCGLTKPCFSQQVFHGGMRLTGCDRMVTTVRGVKPSRQCSQPGSLNPGIGARIGWYGQTN